MIPSERLAYLNGLIKGMKLSGETREEKLFLAITAAINEISDVLDCYDEAFDGMAEILADVEESVYDLEDEVYGDNSEYGEYGEYGEIEGFDEDVYDITCGNCDKTITVDYDALDAGSVTCPSCGELIEFTIEDED